MRLSLVVAAYNVEPYIDRFLHSIFSQKSRLKSFEVIIVDDGSTDGTAQIVKEWQSRYPKHISYVYQKNAGVAAARNTGLALACGTWVNFADSDDFFDADYFRKMLEETEVVHAKPLLAVVENFIFYYEDIDKISDSHPQKYRFAKGTIRRDSSDLGEYMQLSINNCWLHRETIIRHNHRLDSRVVPAFEDAHFINKIFISAPNRTVTFLPSAKYYYRKRSDKNSIIDTSKTKPSWYLDQIEFGLLDVLESSKRCLGRVPTYIQRSCLYDAFWKIRHLLNNSERADFLSDQEKKKFISLIDRVMSFIDVETIANFNLADCYEEHKVALLGLYKQTRRDNINIYLRDMDAAAGLVQFSYFTGGQDDFIVSPRVNGHVVPALLPSQRRAEFMGQTYFREHFFWVRMEDADDIRFEGGDQPCRIRRHGKAVGERADWLTLRLALNADTPLKPDGEVQRLRAYVRNTRDIYRDCYVLMDRDDKADDNAEHLYRHMMASGRAGKAWFVLKRDSLDWDRLEAEGFKLLAFGSDDHIAAQMNASVLLSSHADHYVLWPVPQKDFQDLARYKFVFLQHGVTTNDLSGWLNSKPIRLFVTAMPAEAKDIGHSSGPYKFTSRETLLSGFPRHDALIRKSKAEHGRSILIMPTWRKYLTDESDRDGSQRAKVADFLESSFFLNWSAVLQSPQLRKLAEQHGLSVTFAPHPYMAMYLEDMNLPDWLEVVDVRNGLSYQDLFACAKLVVTDFSSAASEVAYIQRPVVYFQFDADQMFSGDHSYKRGYFSFERDGFGPVVTTAPDVLARLEDALSGREDPVYAARRAAAFPFRDGGCCERVCTAVERLLAPRPALPPLHASQNAALPSEPSQTPMRPISAAA